MADDPSVSILAETALATAAVSMFAPKMAPGWLKRRRFFPFARGSGPFRAVPADKILAKSCGLSANAYRRPNYARSSQGKGTVMHIQLLLMCASACVGLGEKERAREYLLEALALGMPYGFITPFAENVANLGGLVEECVKQQYPNAYDAVLAQWQKTWKNWAMFHNHSPGTMCR